MLPQIAHYNKFSDELKKKLKERIDSYGNRVRYKFDISHINPDPQRYNGDIVWPNTYTLDPAVFKIREGNESVNVAVVEGTDEKNLPNKFRKVRVYARNKGILELDLENPEDIDTAVFIELHPKNKTGLFPDKNKKMVIEVISELQVANQERKLRSARKLAMDTAEKMTKKEIMDFADAMLWDSTEEELVLRNKTEDLAEKDPTYFNDLVKDKKTKFLSAIKRALDKKIWQYNPSDGKLSWASTGQPIVVLGTDAGLGGWDKYAEWFMTAGAKADDVFKKLLSLEKSEVVENS